MKMYNNILFKYKWPVGVLLFSLLSVLFFFLSVNELVRLSIEEATERETQIENLHISWSWSPRFSLDSITLKGFDPGSEQGDYLRAEGVRGDVSLFSLFADRLEVGELDVASLLLDMQFSSSSAAVVGAVDEVPFLSTALPVLGEMTVGSFNVLSRDTQGGVTEQLVDHVISVRTNRSLVGGTHDFYSTGYWGRHLLKLEGPITLDTFSLSALALAISLDEQPLQADIEVTLSSTKPLIDIILSGSRIDTKKNIAKLDPSLVNAGQSVQSRMFSDAILPLPWLRDVDVNFESKLDRVVIGDLVFDHATHYAVLKDGLLQANLSAKGIRGGTLIGKFDVDFRTGLRAQIKASATLRELPLHYIPRVYGLGLKRGGELDARFEIDAIGRSLAELAANSEGEIQVIVGEGVLRDRWIDNIGGDMARALGHWVSGDGKSKNGLNCLAANLRIEDGLIDVSNKSMVFSTSGATIVASGKLDLASENVRLRVVPMARKGTGLNVGSYINVVQLGGTLSDLRPSFNSVGAIKAGTSLWLATATSGLSLVAEGYLKRRFRKDVYCEDVIPQGVFPAVD